MNVNSFFIGKNINEEEFLNLRETRKKVCFLEQVIRYWGDKVFCYSQFNKNGVEEEWVFKYNVVAACSGCRRTQKVLRKIFGSCEEFNQLPFVLFLGNNFYFFNFILLKRFSEKGDHCSFREKKEMYEKWLKE